MSCTPGKPCWEGFKRRRALGLLALLTVVFIALSFASFTSSRKQAIPSQVTYAGHDAVAGKRVFQAYNCMGCHTMVGNGAYFAPDLTKLYGRVGPAWLEAFLPSAASWPVVGMVQLKTTDPDVIAEVGGVSLDAYFDKYPAAKERVELRGGAHSTMPNLPLSTTEVKQLVAFLKYTSEMHTEGWPPASLGAIDPLLKKTQATTTGESADTGTTQPVSAKSDDQTSTQLGAKLVKELGCTACHALDAHKGVGPGWGGLYGRTEKLSDGTTATVDETYLAESIRNPNTHIVEGYPPSMPSYASLSDDKVAAIVEYIKSLEEK